MRLATYQSSTGSGPHAAALERGMAALGHHVEAYRPGIGYDLVLVHGQVAHRTDYVYPPFPVGNTPIAFVDFAEFGWQTRLPGNFQHYANCFTLAAMGHDTKNTGEQDRLRRCLAGRSFPYFLREMHRGIEYPASYHPIDYPLYHLSSDTTRPDREEYLRRSLELFCWWGHSHPWRANIEQALRDAHRTAEIGNRWSDTDMPQSAYFERMRAAKCTVSFDGYGSGSFRMTEALCRTLLLQGPLSIVTRAPLIDGVTCRMYDVQSAGEELCGTNVADVLREALEDAEGSYRIYEAGFEHVHEHLTERATAQYVLDTVAAHDWGAVTPLEV